MNPTLIQYRMVLSNFPLCLFVTSPFNTEKPRFHYSPYIPLFVPSQCDCTAPSELLTQTPTRKNITNQHSIYAQFLSSLLFQFLIKIPFSIVT